nr:hypothetical protein KitaXyl93_38480 [Kitasatospora sp. Xyl93]
MHADQWLNLAEPMSRHSPAGLDRSSGGTCPPDRIGTAGEAAADAASGPELPDGVRVHAMYVSPPEEEEHA